MRTCSRCGFLPIAKSGILRATHPRIPGKVPRPGFIFAGASAFNPPGQHRRLRLMGVTEGELETPFQGRNHGRGSPGGGAAWLP